MKVGIVTINSVNYGNRLQNYALQTVLEDHGFHAETIRRDKPSFFATVKKSLRNLLKNDSYKAFFEFDNEHIKFSRLVLSKKHVDSGLDAEYDKFVIGSDQVWNPNFPFNSDLDYLPNIPSGRKMAYAASFGISQIADDKREHTARLLSDIPLISVREDAGKRIVEELTGRDVPVVLDPTLLLEPDRWAEISRRPKCVNLPKRYIAKYILGEDVNSHEIEKVAGGMQCEIVDMFDKNLKIGPSEFVWLISHSEMVCTDSFHASVFSLLFHRPLSIYERAGEGEDMSSRFDTLCSLFNLKNIRSSDPGFDPMNINSIDWDEFEGILAKARTASLNWLKGGVRS